MANALTNKLGPLPTWAWLLIVTVVIGVFYLSTRHKSATSASSSATSTVPVSAVPDYVFQNYNELPAEAPAPAAAPAPAPAPAPHHKPQPARKPKQVKVPAKGHTPTLAQVARKYHTTPAAIIASSQGNGNPHGPAWKEYVRRKDWTMPLPHGTNLDVYAR